MANRSKSALGTPNLILLKDFRKEGSELMQRLWSCHAIFGAAGRDRSKALRVQPKAYSLLDTQHFIAIPTKSARLFDRPIPDADNG